MAPIWCLSSGALPITSPAFCEAHHPASADRADSAARIRRQSVDGKTTWPCSAQTIIARADEVIE
jgi:hypothetical protein